MKKHTKKYEAQALAIAMVVLVVSSLVGISVYSRTMEDKSLTLEERSSAEALEVSDVILDELTVFEIGDLIDGLGDFDPEEGIVLEENSESSEITTFLSQMGVLVGQDVGSLVSPICPTTQAGNEYQISLKSLDPDTYYEIRPGHVWSLPSKDLLEEAGEDCNLNLKLVVRGDTRAGFVLTKLYCEYDEDGATSCEEYAYEDITSYCFSDDSVNCNNGDFRDTDNWEKYNLSIEEEINIAMSGEDAPTEVRVRAVGGVVGINYQLPDCIGEGLRMFQLRATANCSGVYRGKEILIPETKWYSPVFDYVLFNGEGSI